MSKNQQIESPGCDVIYLCGEGSMGKTWVAKGLELQASAHGRKVKVLDDLSFRNSTNMDREIIRACCDDDVSELIVCWNAGQAENFPVKPFRVIRIGTE